MLAMLGKVGPVVILALPFLALILAAFGVFDPQSGHASSSYLAGRELVLANWWFNTLLSGFVAMLVAIILGTSMAWLLQHYSFPGHGLAAFLAVMPLAVPPYLASYTLNGFLDINGPLSRLIAALGIDDNFRLALSGPLVLGLVLGCQLYPYIYLSLVPALSGNLAGPLAASRTLGKRGLGLLLSPGLALLRPFIASGAALVLMESLNEYGAAAFLGVPTVTAGLLRAWNHAFDLSAAIQLGLGLASFAVLVTILERFLRRKQRFGQAKGNRPPIIEARKLTGGKALLVTLVTFAPIFFGLGLPLIQLAWWGLRFDQLSPLLTLNGALNTLILSAGTGLIALVLALAGVLLPRLERAKQHLHGIGTAISSFLADAAYGIPGVIGALAVLSLAGLSGLSVSAFTSGFGLLIYALLVRYYAVGHNSLHANFKHRVVAHEAPALLLGASRFRIVWSIDLPLLRPAAIAASLMLMLDISKELSATLLLRPLGFETLATLLYEQSSQELPHLNALPGFALIGVSVVIILLTRLSRLRTWRKGHKEPTNE